MDQDQESTFSESFRTQTEFKIDLLSNSMSELTRTLTAIKNNIEILSLEVKTKNTVLEEQIQNLKTNHDTSRGQNGEFGTPMSSTQREDPDQHNFANYKTAIVNQINPEPFNGNSKYAKQWYDDYDNKMTTNGYSSIEKFARVRAYLRGEAADWFEITQETEPVFTWANFKPKFLKYFGGIDYKQIAEKKLVEAKQIRNEHPTKYLVRILKLCKEYDPSMTNDEKIRRIMNGLDRTIRNSLLSSKLKSEWSIEWLRQTFEDMEVGYKDVSYNSTTPQEAKDQDLSNWTCFNCLLKGHKTIKCTKPIDQDQINKNKEAYFKQKDENRHNSRKTSTQIHSIGKKMIEYNLPCHNIAKNIITVQIDGHDITGRVDTGSDFTVLPVNIAQELKLKINKWNYGNPKTVSGDIEPVGSATALFVYKYKVRPLMIMVCDSKADVLFGIDFTSAFDYGQDQLDANNNDMKINKLEAQTIDESETKHPINSTLR